MLTVAFQAALHLTTNWTAAEIAARTAAALSPHFPPAPSVVEESSLTLNACMMRASLLARHSILTLHLSDLLSTAMMTSCNSLRP